MRPKAWHCHARATSARSPYVRGSASPFAHAHKRCYHSEYIPWFWHVQNLGTRRFKHATLAGHDVPEGDDIVSGPRPPLATLCAFRAANTIMATMAHTTKHVKTRMILSVYSRLTKEAINCIKIQDTGSQIQGSDSRGAPHKKKPWNLIPSSHNTRTLRDSARSLSIISRFDMTFPMLS
jgi:hypothetical protein